MFLVVGLGNPGQKYERTRHNVGFVIATGLARQCGAGDFREKFGGLVTKGEVGGVPLTFLLPQTFMNLSGDSVQPAVAFLRTPLEQVIVVHDELDLPWGDIRIKVGGGHAGHNGLRSIIGSLGPDFVRVRVGIGRPPAGFQGDVADYVLQEFDALEKVELSRIVERGVDAVLRVLEGGTEGAMNAVNSRLPPGRGGRGRG